MKRKSTFETVLICLPVRIITLLLAINLGCSSCDSRTRHSGDDLKELEAAIVKFDLKTFSTPPAFFYPGFFWSWNDTLSKELIKEQLADMSDHGIKNIVPLPLPREFRPSNMPTLMEPDYLSPGYMELFKYTAEQCKKLGLKLWLYDEGGWPSGSCLGRVVGTDSSLARQSLIRRVEQPARGTTYEVPSDCLAAYLYDGDKLISRLSPGAKQPISSVNQIILVFRVNKSGAYPDLLKAASTLEFINLTHEKYREAAGKYFGNTMQITFTDEAKAANPGWTDDMASEFKKSYGYDLLDVLPSIFEGDSDADKKVRIDYFDWWTQRHADVYYGKIQEWCKENNLLSGGHLDGEDATITARRSGYGHPLRALRKMDVPGVDAIWRQLWPGNRNHHFPKYASTVAHQAGTPWSFTESFAVYGNGLTPAQMKWISDYQFVRGINMMIISGYSQSIKNWFSGGLRPVYRKENPQWKYMDIYNSYMARLGYLMSIGKPDIKIAVYYPARDIWAGGSKLDSVCSSNDMLANVLLENQCDFDFVDDDILEDDSTVISSNQIVAGAMRYDAVCVSRCSFMSQKSAEKLGRFALAGGKVIFTDVPGGSIIPEGSVEAGFDELPSLLQHTVMTEGDNRNIRALKRVAENGSVYFITNEDTTATSCTLIFNEKSNPILLDPETGSCMPSSGAEKTALGWKIPVNLEFAGSRIFFFTDDKLSLSPVPPKPGSVLQTIAEDWTIRKIREYTVETTNTIISEEDKAGKVSKPGDWREMLGNAFSGDAEYTVNFSCGKDIIKNGHILDLGDVRYACSASINGENLGRRTRQPYTFDVSNKLNENNLLKVTVTNTMANQYIYNTAAFEKWTIRQLGPYHVRQLAFEKESVASGLFGPVTIR